MTGRFISLEGGVGVGKSTQCARLAEALRRLGFSVVETREPGGSAGAEAIRGLLLKGEEDRWSAAAEALLFAAARSDHVDRTIRPALTRGDWVVCDRFIDSSLAYQGIVGDVGLESVRKLHRIGSGGLLPDRTLLLRLDAAESARRTSHRDGEGSDRFGMRAEAFHARIAAAFGQLAAEAPERFRLVDCNGSQEQVTERLVAALEDLF
ncbi:MAG: dTMP kinase [Sphingosinicella sp.]